MIQGLRTVIYPVTNLGEASAWYERVLERAPYFSEAFYVGFEVGGFELGLIPDGRPGDSGGIAYWGVPDADAELARLLELGASLDQAVEDVGGGIRVATVRDPDGNRFGMIENPYFNPGKVA